MAIKWNIKSTKNLGKGYKDCVKGMANRHGYGSLYEATRRGDKDTLGLHHAWTCKTKKFFGLGGKYQFTVETQKILDGSEAGMGYGPDVSKI